jgi:dipeptidyl aminopeptidase/acylaminoacyl peptidase
MRDSGTLKTTLSSMSRLSCLGFSMLWLLHPMMEPKAQDLPRSIARHPVTVTDSIRMTRVANSAPAQFSADGNKFIVVLKRGNLKQNSIDYQLLLWRKADVFHSPTPEVLLNMSSTSNRAAIESVTWLSDNETIAFLGEYPQQLHQLYTLDTKTRRLKRITNHPSNIVSYSVTPKGDRIAYIAEEAPRSVWNARSRRDGFVVSTEYILDLLQGRTGNEGVFAAHALFISSPGRSCHRLEPRDSDGGHITGNLALSPNGKYVIIPTELSNVPSNWAEYTQPDIQRLVSVTLGPGQRTFLERFELVDTVTGESRFLLNSPLGAYGSDVGWAPDSRSVVITRVFLPLVSTQGQERATRRAKTFTVEVSVPTGDITKISEEDLYGVEWNAKSDQITSHALRPESNTELGLGESVFFRKDRRNWEKVGASSLEETRPEIVVEEAMNVPPKLFAVDPKTRRKSLLFDLNPQFAELKFAEVVEIQWKGTDGHDVTGGLYYPKDYVSGTKYPLVIQTHGWSPKQFMIDGPTTTGYAAQALASVGIFVLQADDSNLTTLSTEGEAATEVAGYEGAIDYLNQRGLIDRDRVGVMGFSRSCFFVKYALTHSSYHFAAASILDGIDGGYVQYVDFANTFPGMGDEFEKANDGHPWGKGLQSWFDKAPGFNVDRVQTPLHIVALNPGSLLGEWEWFALLSRMGKPVEMVYLEDGKHELVRPLDRIVAQQGNTDWFRFWLKGEEDLDPVKADQYARWRKLQKLVRSTH